MNRNRDLLFAVIALQMRFITRGQFLEAGEAWANDPDKGLADHLQALGHIEDSVRRSIEALVEEHEKQAAENDTPETLSCISMDPVTASSILELPEEMSKSISLFMGDLFPDDDADEDAPSLYEGEDRYLREEEIGRGGLGRVLAAEDRVLKRKVAVKEMLSGVDSPGLHRRFLREGEIAGRLSHPNIIPVHDIGISSPEQGRRPYFVMTRIHGRDLKEILEDLESNSESRAVYTRHRLLAIFQDICRAVAYAHDQGVIHRDLKPANIMVGDYGEVYVVDWGLAKILGQSIDSDNADGITNLADSETVDLTLDGQVLGTPAYMPPEQAQGQLSLVDRQSDIYSLGAILYEILTLLPPYEGPTLLKVIATVIKGDLTPPSTRLEEVAQSLRSTKSYPPEVPQELEDICLRAMAPDKPTRYATVMDLEDDVQRFLEGQKEKERRLAEARERVAEGRQHLARFDELHGVIEEEEDEQTRRWKEINEWDSEETKKPFWEAKARIKETRKERMTEFGLAEGAFGAALQADPENEEAMDGRCALYLQRFSAAESRRDEEEMTLYRGLLAQSDKHGTWLGRIDQPGTLTLRTFHYDCRCLSPCTDLRVVFGRDAVVPWRDGKPLWGEALRPKDCPIPETWIVGPQGRSHPPFGHGTGCTRKEVEGAEVEVFRYEQRLLRLVPGPGRVLGKTPLEGVELAQGSYLCILRHPSFGEARLPVLISRNASWEQEVNLYREIPKDFAFIPGGPFFQGRKSERSGKYRKRETPDFFMARTPVSWAEYIAFLDDMAGHDVEEALSHQPHEGDRHFLIEKNGVFAIPSKDDNPKGMAPDVPVFGLTWDDALSYCSWASARDGRLYTPPHELEWQKGARGVDGRIYPWGNDFDDAFSNTIISHEGGPCLRKPGSFPTDLSPYGLWDMAGNMVSWAFNAPEEKYRSDRVLCGGAWCYSADRANMTNRMGLEPITAYRHSGIRLALRLHPA